VNLLFQSYALFPHMTVEQNVAFGLGQGKLSKEVIAERVKRTLALVGLSEIAGRKPDQITVAQQQRLALARCLAKEPKLLLLDELTANLDRELRTEIQLEIAEILRRVRATTILVTRDREEAMVMADRLALMKSGRIVQTGTPAEVYESPNCKFSAQLLGAINLFSGTVASAEDGIAVVEVPDLDIPLKVIVTEAVRPGSAVTVAVRPERFVIQADRPDSRHNVCVGFIEDSAYAGAYTHYYVRLSSGRTIVILSEARERQRAQPLDSGARLFVTWDATDGVVLES
jgi:putrescine transport system ATP-binding protein